MQVGKTVKKYFLSKKIGEGAFSTVYKAVDINNNEKEFAIKSLKKFQQKKDQELIMNEIKLIKAIKHKNVVNFIEDFKTPNGGWYIVFQFCGKGDLQEFIKKQGRLPENVCRKFANSMIDVLLILHQKGIAHRDLKIQNILINDNFEFKIADFGLAKRTDQGIFETFCGSYFAMPPEIYRSMQYTAKCDVWSFGVMLYNVAFGKIPFFARTVPQIRRLITLKQPDFNSDIQISDQFKDFIKKCLIKDPELRPSIKQLKQNQWLSVLGATAVCRQFFKTSFNEGAESEVAKKTKAVLRRVIEFHVNKIIQFFVISQGQIQVQMHILKKYYKNQYDKVRKLIIATYYKLIESIMSSTIVIHLDKNKVELPLNSINIFKTHYQNFKKYLSKNLPAQQYQKMPQTDLQLINFNITNTSELLANPNPEHQLIDLLLFTSELPLYEKDHSEIDITWDYSQVNQKAKKQYLSYVEGLKTSDVVVLANDGGKAQSNLENWIVEHYIQRRLRNGNHFTLGQYMRFLITTNCMPE